MKVTIMFCLIGAIFANPISHNVVLESSELDPNTTESMSVSQSSENDTSEIKSQSSEENSSRQSQSSESESAETTSEDTTSEESDSQSVEDDETDSLAETRDDSMGSEENVRKSWVRVFASVIKALSAEDNSSTEVAGGQSDQLPEKQPTQTSAASQGDRNLQLVDKPATSSDTTSESSDTGEVTAVTAASSDSSESKSSESSEASDSSDASESAEDSNASDSMELEQLKTPGCVNGTESCESEEYFFQDIGDDGHHHSVDNLMVPDEDERELFLRR